MPSLGTQLFAQDMKEHVLIHLVEADFVGIPNGIPRVAVKTEGAAAQKSSNAS